jgi:hypothetical protein
MKYIDLLQRLQHNPQEAVIVYHDQLYDGHLAEGAAWIVDFRGIVQSQFNVDVAMAKAIKARTVRPVAMLVHGRQMLFRPTSDFTEAHE